MLLQFSEIKKRELSDVYSALSIGIVKVKKADGFPLLSANDAFFEMIGYTREQFAVECGGLIKNITFGADGGYYDEMYPGKRSSGRYRVVKRDGSLFWARYDAMLTPKEEDVYYIMYTDISDMVEAEQLLSQQKYYGELADKGTPGTTIIFSCMKRGVKPLYIRGDTIGMCGYTQEELKRFSENGYRGILHEDDLARVTDFIGDILKRRPEEAQIEFRLRCKNEKIIWVMLQCSIAADYFGDDAYISMVMDITAQKDRESEALIQSNIDQLTGALNRSAFIENVEAVFESSAQNQRHAVIMLDIDDFKRINDQRGHSVGDEALCSITSVLRELLRSDDLIGRLGGDEFMVLLRNVQSEGVLAQKCAEICRRISEIIVDQTGISASLGAASYPKDAKNFETMYLCVDTAMYEAKRRGKNTYCIYSQDMQNMTLI